MLKLSMMKQVGISLHLILLGVEVALEVAAVDHHCKYTIS